MDLLFYNAVIHTLDENHAIREAIGIKDNKIVFVGSNNEAKCINAKEKINLHGQLMLPGFIDTHMHLLDYAFEQKYLKLYECESIEDIIKKGSNHLNKNKSNDVWIVGKGWDQNKFNDEQRFLTRADLDQISTENPLFYSRVCGHVATVNSLALEKIVAMKETKRLMDFIDVEKGILRESAVFLYTKSLENVSIGDIKAMISLAQADLNKLGITGVHTVDFLALPSNSWEKIVLAYKSLEEDNKLTVRIYEQCMFSNMDYYQNFLDKGYRTGNGHAFFKIGPLKLFADGSLGARTALMKEPYSDDYTTHGLQVLSDSELMNYFIVSHKYNMQLAIHGIGDKAIETVVGLLNELNISSPKNSMRHGIVHAQITNLRILEKMKKGNLLAYIQPVFINDDMHIVKDRIGEHRMKNIYAWKTMREMGIKRSGGSDAPVVSFDVVENIYFAVTRKNIDGLPKEGWLPHEKLTVDEAVRLFTIDAAYASFEETEKGSLEIGKTADMIVLDKNIYKISPEEIIKTKVIKTIVDGKIVYSKEA